MPSISRRQYLGAISTTALTAIAGCQSNSCTPSEPGNTHWPQFRGGSRNTNAAPDFPALTSSGSYWTTDLEDTIDIVGIATARNRIVVVGSETGQNGGVLTTIQLNDGSSDTAHELERGATSPPALVGSLAITPVLGDYTDPSTGGVVAIDLDSWTESWTHEIDGRPNAPTVSENLVIVSSDQGDVTAIDAGSGDIEWTRNFGDDHQNAAIPAPPAIDSNRVYVSAQGSAMQGVYALDRDSGETLWSIPGPDIPAPFVRAGDVVLGSYREYELAAFDVETGKSQWSQAIHGGRLFAPAVADDRVFSADRETVYALSLGRGESDWETELTVRGVPLVVGNSVVVPTQDGLVGLSIEDGTERWTISESPDTACVPVENGLIYAVENSVTLRTTCK
ncbi:PQQ-binding-like beta-propeller repeat protein [Halobacterium sp. KA-6]|uniref:PQQ-binding-like beta-propeller repeat protein n=1 Tax=Halobacterium sp. KA-6 TaxID=2896368 RepID=UPI001E5488E9|nr:PQQ-binding-like beta-propeller repeat protein [Halobacterium sp. KA-6]MCD2205133.1 PQQ-like beta-propeller repeat protein [Halobacterium sp. KA-6]